MKRGVLLVLLGIVCIIALSNGSELNMDSLIPGWESFLAKIDVNRLQRMSERIGIVRPAGSKGRDQVRKYIMNQMKLLKNWTVETDDFEQDTIQGRVNFSNIIATRNNMAAQQQGRQRFILAAHYDSKYFATGKFIGATDSAVPCAMMLEIAILIESLDLLTLNSANVSKYDLQLIFFDGEEAFRQWTSTDSIYGSRHLANKWSNSNNLSNIKTFTLLDLIGSYDTTLWSFFQNTLSDYNVLKSIEQALDPQLTNSQPYFAGESLAGIEDDHIPFERKGVPILHLIAYPFPRVWHTVDDDLANISWPTVKDLTCILGVYFSSILNIRADAAGISPSHSSSPQIHSTSSTSSLRARINKGTIY